MCANQNEHLKELSIEIFCKYCPFVAHNKQNEISIVTKTFSVKEQSQIY